MRELILLHSRVVAGVVVGFLVIAIVFLGVFLYLAIKYHAIFVGYTRKKENDKEKEKALATLGSTNSSSRLDAANCSSNEMGEFLHFQDGEHLNAEAVLNAPGEVVGKTTYGTTYKATLGDGSMIALRLMRAEVIVGSSASIGITFSSYIKSAIEEIGAIRHSNLVPLLAHYSGLSGERLLIYPFFPRRSLADLLHGGSGAGSTLGWTLRHRVLLGAARGLAYLHHGLRRAHANIKSKNILVDHDYHGHVTNLGIEKLMNLATTQADMLPLSARLGYKAPELHTITKANPKSDIFSFGIVILEAITGKKPWISKGNPTVLKWSTLPAFVKCALVEERVEELFDTPILLELKSYWNNCCIIGKQEVENRWDLGLVEALQLGIACCAFSPHCRPDIGEVVKQLEVIGTRISTTTSLPFLKHPFKTPLLPTSFNDQYHR